MAPLLLCSVILAGLAVVRTDAAPVAQPRANNPCWYLAHARWICDGDARYVRCCEEAGVMQVCEAQQCKVGCWPSDGYLGDRPGCINSDMAMLLKQIHETASGQSGDQALEATSTPSVELELALEANNTPSVELVAGAPARYNPCWYLSQPKWICDGDARYVHCCEKGGVLQVCEAQGCAMGCWPNAGYRGNRPGCMNSETAMLVKTHEVDLAGRDDLFRI